MGKFPRLLILALLLISSSEFSLNKHKIMKNNKNMYFLEKYFIYSDFQLLCKLV